MQPFVRHVEAALSALKQGKMIILVDHPDRENEGDIIFPAEMINESTMSFMIRHCSGIVCLSLTEEKLKQLGLTYMVPPHANTSQRGTPFIVSIEAKTGISTGVSAKDRATTVLAAVNEQATESDIVKPGHIFPLQARAGGVLERAGHTEGAVDIVRLAGFQPAAVLCEVMNPDGTMTRGQQLAAFAKEHDLVILSIEDIIHYRLLQDQLIQEETSTPLPLSAYGAFNITVVKEKWNGKEHIILEYDKLSAQQLVRIHSSCMTGDLFGSLRCDCHQQLHYSLQRISEEGGLLIYLNQEGRDIGLFNKIKSYALQAEGMDTVEANECLQLPVDARKYYIAANILRNRQINSVRLLTNNPRKMEDLQKYGIAAVEREAMPIFCNRHNERYLLAKKNKLNHFINDEREDDDVYRHCSQSI